MNLVTFYTVLLVLGVLVGSRLDKIVRLTHTRTQLLMSLISGLLLGIAVFHLLPHAVYSSALSIDVLARYLMLGLLTMFFLQRMFHFHHHEYDSSSEQKYHEHSHAAHCEHTHGESQSSMGRAGIGVIIGLAIHSVMDGIALAFSIQADWHLSNSTQSFAALGVFLAILLHKPLDALTLSLFLRERAKQKNTSEVSQLIILLGYALICPVVVILILQTGRGDWISPEIISAVLAFSAGLFLCIALSDLLPEIHFHDHDRGKMAIMLLLGVGLSLCLGVIESDHRHQHQPSAMESEFTQKERLRHSEHSNDDPHKSRKLDGAFNHDHSN